MLYKEKALVIKQANLAEGIYSLWLQTEQISKEAKAGQFVSLYCKDGSRLLPRPISICEIDAAESSLRLVYRVMGKGTEEFSRLESGDCLEILGPLGNGFPIKEGKALLVGGGLGIPPLLQLAVELRGAKQIVLGYKDEVFLDFDFTKCINSRIHVSTEDGSKGSKGNVMAVLEDIKKQRPPVDVIYACGPLPMLAAIKKYAAEQDIECWVSLEERMACGIGACYACACKINKKNDQRGVHNQRVCKKGPVFLAEEWTPAWPSPKATTQVANREKASDKQEIDLSVNLAGVIWKNPVTVASGTFAYGKEYGKFVDLNRLGAVTTKGISTIHWEGNPTPRVAETYGGMLNAIGLQNPGLEEFIERHLPNLSKFDTKLIVNVCGKTMEEYCRVVERLRDTAVDLLEINISCPNVSEGCLAFGQEAKAVEKVAGEVKKYAKQPIILKLSPNVTDIAEMALAAEAGGADALSLINTLTGMKIDIEKRSFAIANRTGGLSGPAIHPVAVRMVYQVAQAVKIPIIGMGGIATAEDAIEMMLAGATAVAVGTANFRNPFATMEILDGIKAYLERHGVQDIKELIGAAR